MEKLTVTDQLYLKRVSVSDATDLFYIMSNERDRLREFLPFIDYTQKVSDTEEFIRSTINGDKDGLNSVYVIRYKEETVGLIGYKDTDAANKRTEIGYWLSPCFWGKGIVTQACATLIGHAFSQMDMNRVQLKIAIANSKSTAIAKRLGFTLEGQERDGELLSDGFTDLFIYSILKNEWTNR